MHHSRVLKAPVVVLMLILLVAACGSSGGSKAASDSSSSSGGNGDKAAFCKTNSDINSALQKATSPNDVLAAFKKFEGDFDDYLKNAPSEVKSAAKTQVDFARKAIKDNDPQSLLTEDKNLTAASDKVDTFCGVKSSSSSSSSDTDTSSSSSSTEAGGSAAACAAFADIQEFSTLSGEVATKSWPEIQSLFAEKRSAIAAAYEKIANAAPPDTAADVRVVAAFTEKLIAAAATASSPQEWAQSIGSLPEAQKASDAAARMGTFAQTQCGIDVTGASSS